MGFGNGPGIQPRNQQAAARRGFEDFVGYLLARQNVRQIARGNQFVSRRVGRIDANEIAQPCGGFIGEFWQINRPWCWLLWLRI